MSMDRCTECFRAIDTDFDLDCYIADKVICERCRDAMQTDGRLIVVDGEYRIVSDDNKTLEPGAAKATLWTSGWSGRLAQDVIVIGSTPKKFRIRAIERTKLAGRNRWLAAGETCLVPKHAVTFHKTEGQP